MLTLTPAQRSSLRAQAHGLHPVVLIGEAGLTPGVLKEIDASLKAHGLIKIRVFGDDRAAREEIYHSICSKLEAAPVQHIGKLLVVYRPQPEPLAAPDAKAGKGLREVTIVKPGAGGTRRPTVSKVILKGNERVTAGGSIKRAKPRQASSKKRFLD